MIKALLRSEWIKFRSYYLALGAALVALVFVRIPDLTNSLAK